jgi:hypothetical protein
MVTLLEVPAEDVHPQSIRSLTDVAARLTNINRTARSAAQLKAEGSVPKSG